MFVSVFVPVIAIAEYTPSEHLFHALREDGVEVSHFLVSPESLELVGRPRLPQFGFSKPRSD